MLDREIADWGERPLLDLVTACAPDAAVILALLSAFDVRVEPSSRKRAHCSLLVATAAACAHELAGVLARGTAPVVVCLIDGRPDDLAAAMEQGAQDAVVGTSAPAEIVVRIHSAIRRARGSTPNVIHAAGIEIELQKRIVRRGSREVTLSATECALLLSVARREGDVVSIETLAKEVWGRAMTAGHVHTYVSYLRHKVDDPSRKSILRTVRGLGYALAQ